MNNKLDILLVVPHQPDTADILSSASGITAPLGIGYIASFLEKNNFSVKILDNSIEKLKGTRFKAYIRRARPFCIGFSVCTSSYNNAIYLANLAKELDKGIIVLMGGVHPSALPHEVLKNESVDIVVKGEGEETTAEVLKSLRKGEDLLKVNGLFFRKGQNIVETADRILSTAIDSLPFPAYHLLPMRKYTLPASRKLTSKRCASIITSRGCAYNCFFCSHRSVFKGKPRFRSPKNVIDEIKYLIKNYNIGELLIWDDSFLLDKNRAINICRMIKRENIDIVWSCSSRVNQISYDLSRELYSAGCRFVLFGAESGSQHILDSINKRTTLSEIRQAVAVCRRSKLISFCSFIIGVPEESEYTVKETIEFVKKLNPDFAIFCIFAPLPGSVFFDRLLAQGKIRIGSLDWDNYINLLYSAPPVVSVGKLSRRRLVQLQARCFRVFYFRFSYILRRLTNIYSWNNFYQAWRGLKAIVRLQLNKFHF